MGDNLVYKRILLKLSGEALAGEKGSGIDFDYVLNFINELNRKCADLTAFKERADSEYTSAKKASKKFKTKAEAYEYADRLASERDMALTVKKKDGKFQKAENAKKSVEEICEIAYKMGVQYLTVYAFSTENWKRPADEVNALMKLFKSYLEEAISDFKDEDIVVKFIGDKTAFSPELQQLIDENEKMSAHRTGMVLNIAMNYGSRDEIIRAVKNIALQVKDGKLDVEDITSDVISNNLYTAGQPDPDLVIRPSGEYRISNFLLWQSAYTEYVIMDVLWPDFSEEMLDEALIEYAKRNRRFGGV